MVRWTGLASTLNRKHNWQAFEALGAEPLTGIIKADALMMMLKRIGYTPILNLRSTTSQKCAVVPRRARS